MKRERLEIPEAWESLEPKKWTGTVLVVGATDSGKSTLVRYLLRRLSRDFGRVGWIDGDIGQSVLGLPGTQNLSLIEDPGDDWPPPDASFFIGSTSPRGHMLPVLTGLARLQDRAERKGASVTVVDTTGLVAPERGGGALKQWLAELLRPSTIVALQREDELEHLLEPWRRDRRFSLHVLPVAAAARRRSREERTDHRRRQFRDYFRTAGLRKISTESVAIYGDRAHMQRGALLGLQDEEGALSGLAALQRCAREEWSLITPLTDLTPVRSIRFGQLRVDPQSGEELPE